MVRGPQNIHTKAFYYRDKNTVHLDGNKNHISPNKAHKYHWIRFFIGMINDVNIP